MPGGLEELASVPMAYRLRHLPPKRKQAVVSTVCEETVHRIVGWNDDEAPVVARVRTPAKADVLYRAARLGDGSIRLVAPLDSPAFTGERADIIRPGLPPLSWIPLFQHPVTRPVNCALFKGLGDNLGVILSGERQAALARTAVIVRTLVVVEGCLHAPCTEPGWLIHVQNDRGRCGGYYDRLKRVNGITAIADQLTDRRIGERFLPFCLNPEQVLTERFDRIAHPLLQAGCIEQLVPGALGGDRHWRTLRDFLLEALDNDPALPTAMLEDELVLRRSLLSALMAWPIERDAALEKAVVRMIRIVHGIKSNGNADLLTGTLLLQEKLAEERAPAPFGERMKAAGLILPEPAIKGGPMGGSQ
jgi:hypothetical protein